MLHSTLSLSVLRVDYIGSRVALSAVTGGPDWAWVDVCSADSADTCTVRRNFSFLLSPESHVKLLCFQLKQRSCLTQPLPSSGTWRAHTSSDLSAKYCYAVHLYTASARSRSRSTKHQLGVLGARKSCVDCDSRVHRMVGCTYGFAEDGNEAAVAF